MENDLQRSLDSFGHTKIFPGFSNLYRMAFSPLGNNCFYASLPDGTPQFELLRREWIPTSPLVARWVMGKPQPGDIARGRTVTWIYISSTLQQSFRERGFTGWGTYPVILYNKVGEKCVGYSGLSIYGRCGALIPSLGKSTPDEHRKPGMPDLEGMYFDELTWDGSDFFLPAGQNAYIIVTEGVKDVFREHTVHGFDFTPLPKATWYQPLV